MLPLWPWLIRFALLTLACTAAVTDLRRRLIPNWLTLPALALGLAAFGLREGGPGLLYALGGAAIPVAVFGLPWLLGGLGGGDFKMAVAIGALGGPLFSLAAIVWDMVWGAVLFAWWMALRGRRGVGEAAPFGIALAGGTLAALAASMWGTDGARVALALAAAAVIGAGAFAALRWMHLRWSPARNPSAPQPLRDERGQAMIIAVLLIVGALLVMFIGGLGVAEDVVYHSSLQTAADAAAMAAAKTAASTEEVTATYRVQSCGTTRRWNGRAWVATTTCSNGPTETTVVSGPSLDLFAPSAGLDGSSIPTWAADAGCNAYKTAPASHGAVVCANWTLAAPLRWTFPHPNAAEEDALSTLQQRMPQAVMTSFRLSAGGSGRVYLSARLAEKSNPASFLFGPVVTRVRSVGAPTT